jgi:hypothetical protein
MNVVHKLSAKLVTPIRVSNVIMDILKFFRLIEGPKIRIKLEKNQQPTLRD